MIPIDLTGKIAVVTGATGELGRVITRTLARAGADVAIVYHRAAERAAALRREVEALGRRAVCVAADVTDEASVAALQRTVAAELGDADILVNNAVIQYAWTSVLQQPTADFESQFRSCVLHNVLMARAFVPAMVGRRWGRVIALSTECLLQCHPNQGAYAAGKGGQDRVLRVLAKEVGEHQVTVNQVAPGWTISDKYRGTPEERQPAYEASVPLRRRGFDHEIAHAVAFLASDLASFITGAVVPVCGGHVMPAV